MKKSVLKKIFIADMYLNFGIFIFLTFFPAKFQSLIVFMPVFPTFIIIERKTKIIKEVTVLLEAEFEAQGFGGLPVTYVPDESRQLIGI